MSTLVPQSGDMMQGDVLIFDTALSGFLSFSGIPVLDVEFVGYMPLGSGDQLTLYPLYLRAYLSLFAYLLAPMVHASQYELLPSNEVPVFTLALNGIDAPFLNLPCVRVRTGIDKMLHGVYNYHGVAWPNESPTMIHLAQFPSGYRHTEGSVDGSDSILQTTWVESSAMTSIAGASGRQAHSKKLKAEHSLHRIMAVCPNWGRALAFLHVHLRIVICCGHSDNPHLLINAKYAECRVELIRSLWPKTLARANIASQDLELVLPVTPRKAFSQNVLLGQTANVFVIVKVIKLHPKVIFCTASPFQVFAKHDSGENILSLSYYPLFNMINDSHFLGIEQTKSALISWLSNQERDILPDSLFVMASMLFGWIDSHDLIALLEVSLKEIETQLQQEQDLCMVSCLQGRCWMEDRMYRAQTEISLFSAAIANLCEELERRSYPNKCNAWLLTLHGDVQLDSDTSQIPFGSLQTEVSHLYDYLVGPDDQFLSLPRMLKTWVDSVAFRAYLSACLAESKPSSITNNDTFKPKERKTLDMLQSDIHVLGLKKRRTQVKVDMLSEAIARMSEFERTNDGGHTVAMLLFLTLRLL
ncbi:uncharacterized protein F5891DRAFT_981297 [Suillus fuscotomentosus]|uniref:Uncharacterized protein n=1 Tax=Suillus fuscotomentosus TaxID=1912939 RepID=A0AAD4HJU3_9AGAM|nr:uncharacterized protein F5891DRAFT_981297 [Suillus fuscotomentosus]KAG1899233.1 hypothetical protein F5891DRAFT_981297 [Suillus fuscotomentosus]